ncbi:MAG: hypothetical protein WC433_07475 [Candidatus Omnitrophota bacterium]
MNCKECNKTFEGKYSKWCSGNFCSKLCATKYSRKQYVSGKKIVYCAVCGKEILVEKRSNPKKCKCDICRSYYINSDGIRKKNNKICKVCGQLICIRKDICNKRLLIPALIKYFGLDKTKLGTIKIYEEFDRIKNMLIEDYYDKELSTVEMAEKYNHNHCGNFNKILDSLGIKKRNLSEAITNAFLHNRIFSHTWISLTYKNGWHETWNGKQVFYRSSYELDYCNELDEKHINYEMEKLRILYWDSQLLKQRIAIPDFYLPDTNEIIEIKSDYTYNEINMKDKLKSYKEHGYKFKLVLEHKEINISVA